MYMSYPRTSSGPTFSTVPRYTVGDFNEQGAETQLDVGFRATAVAFAFLPD